jgi:hypothetical protein
MAAKRRPESLPPWETRARAPTTCRGRFPSRRDRGRYASASRSRPLLGERRVARTRILHREQHRWKSVEVVVDRARAIVAKTDGSVGAVARRLVAGSPAAAECYRAADLVGVFAAWRHCLPALQWTRGRDLVGARAKGQDVGFCDSRRPLRRDRISSTRAPAHRDQREGESLEWREDESFPAEPAPSRAFAIRMDRSLNLVGTKTRELVAPHPLYSGSVTSRSVIAATRWVTFGSPLT